MVYLYIRFVLAIFLGIAFYVTYKFTISYVSSKPSGLPADREGGLNNRDLFSPRQRRSQCAGKKVQRYRVGLRHR